MEIKKVISDKKEFLELLLLADEQESMVDRYLERGDMFVDRKSTRLNSSHDRQSRMPSSA